MKSKRQTLSIFGLSMLNVAAVLSLRGLPLMAETGLTMIFYLFFSAVFFLIPCSLVSAELASAWPEAGGVYHWVKEALGSKWGFLAIWLQWVQNIIWFPTVLAFSASAFAYFLFKPHLATSNQFIAFYIIIVYWSSTLLSFRGLSFIERLTSMAVILGTIIPGVVIIILGALWCFTGKPIMFLIDKNSFMPSLSNFNNISFLAGIVLLFSGMENGAVHVRDLSDPKKQYPKTVFIAVSIIIILFSLGSFSIAAVLPKTDISLTAGIMESFDKMLDIYHLHWLLPILGLLIAFGSVGGVMAWITGPSKGLLATAKCGEIPPFLAHTNKAGIQTHILIIQALIVTVLASLYLVIEDVSVAFFLLSAMTVTLYLIVYFLMFIAVLLLRYTEPEVVRGYRIPGGTLGVWLVSIIGLISVSFAFVIAFFPPTELHISSPKIYFWTVVGGTLFFTGAAFLMQKLKKLSWIK